MHAKKLWLNIHGIGMWKEFWMNVIIYLEDNKICKRLNLKLMLK